MCHKVKIVTFLQKYGKQAPTASQILAAAQVDKDSNAGRKKSDRRYGKRTTESRVARKAFSVLDLYNDHGERVDKPVENDEDEVDSSCILPPACISEVPLDSDLDISSKSRKRKREDTGKNCAKRVKIDLSLQEPRKSTREQKRNSYYNDFVL